MPADLTVRRHADGTLYVRPYLGTNPITGKDVKPYHRLNAKTMADAELEAAEWYASVMGNPLLPVALKDYVDALEDSRRPANTIRTYRTYCATVEPLVAQVRVRDLTVRNLTDIYRELLKGGSRMGRPLSTNTVLGVHWFLRGAYKWFCEQGICTTNPTLLATKPTKDELEAMPLDDVSLAKLKAMLGQALSNQATDMRSATVRAVAFGAWLALYTGLRCGEVCGVWRSDVRAVQKTLHVGGTVIEVRGRPVYQPKPKGKRTRNISLNPEDLKVVRNHILWQESLFTPHGTEVPLISVDGLYMRPSKVAQTFAAMARRAGLPKGTHFHSLRHTHATWLLANGVDVKTVAERLGHASPSTTLSIYAHVLPGRDQAAAKVFRDAIEGF